MTTRVGVIGVGTMGRHHARVYSELPEADLIGVADVDTTTATEIAEEYGTTVLDRAALLDSVDAVSIAVPTRFHHDITTSAIDAGVDPLVEKPLVKDPAKGRDLIDRARRAGVTLQVGHVERFNPAVEVLEDVIADVSPIAISARRQGPPVDRDAQDNVVRDLMIHDLDIILELATGSITSVTAAGAYENNHVVAQLEFDDGVIANLTASRITQQRIRDLSITARDCKVNVDYVDQSIQIHRQSVPEYITRDGEVRYRNESLIERPTVGNGEPLKAEIESFLEAVREEHEPKVSGQDGVQAVELANHIEAMAKSEPSTVEEELQV
jgi:predicted dehydrogenase